MAVAPFGIGMVEMLLVVLLGSGIGIPLGVPQDPDPLLMQMAPEECLYYTMWAGLAEPDPNSPNQAEQLFAEPEVQAFAKEVERAVRAAVDRLMVDVPAHNDEAILIEKSPLLVKTLISRPAVIFVESVLPHRRGVDVKGALVANVGMPQTLPDGTHEKCLVTLGDDLTGIPRFCRGGATDYSAEDVIRTMLG